jgi:xylulokinase
MGFSWGHTQAHFFRAVLESVAFEYAYYLNILRDLIPDLSLLEARVVGGGASSDVWNQIKADVLNVPYQRLQREELGTWGSAMIAGKAVGMYEDLGAVAAIHAKPANQPFNPQPENQEVYKRLSEKYINLQRNLEDIFVRLYSV